MVGKMLVAYSLLAHRVVLHAVSLQSICNSYPTTWHWKRTETTFPGRLQRGTVRCCCSWSRGFMRLRWGKNCLLVLHPVCSFKHRNTTAQWSGTVLLVSLSRSCSSPETRLLPVSISAHRAGLSCRRPRKCPQPAAGLFPTSLLSSYSTLHT